MSLTIVGLRICDLTPCQFHVGAIKYLGLVCYYRLPCSYKNFFLPPLIFKLLLVFVFSPLGTLFRYSNHHIKREFQAVAAEDDDDDDVDLFGEETEEEKKAAEERAAAVKAAGKKKECEYLFYFLILFVTTGWFLVMQVINCSICGVEIVHRVLPTCVQSGLAYY